MLIYFSIQLGCQYNPAQVGQYSNKNYFWTVSKKILILRKPMTKILQSEKLLGNGVKVDAINSLCQKS